MNTPRTPELARKTIIQSAPPTPEGKHATLNPRRDAFQQGTTSPPQATTPSTDATTATEPQSITESLIHMIFWIGNWWLSK